MNDYLDDEEESAVPPHIRDYLLAKKAAREQQDQANSMRGVADYAEIGGNLVSQFANSKAPTTFYAQNLSQMKQGSGPKRVEEDIVSYDASMPDKVINRQRSAAMEAEGRAEKDLKDNVVLQDVTNKAKLSDPTSKSSRASQLLMKSAIMSKAREADLAGDTLGAEQLRNMLQNVDNLSSQEAQLNYEMLKGTDYKDVLNNMAAKDRLKYQEDKEDKRWNAQERMLDKKLAAEKAANSGKEKGIEALDKDFAREYTDWNTAGKPTYEKNLKKLEDSLKVLEAGKEDVIGVSGMQGYLPNIVRSDKSRVLQQDVQGAAQGALKATLGSQFTEKEGEKIMANAYDPTLPPAENIKKIKAAIQEIKQNAYNKDSASRYFEQNKTLRNWQPEKMQEEDVPTGSSSVRIMAPNGKVKLIPADQVNAALSAGGKRVD